MKHAISAIAICSVLAVPLHAQTRTAAAPAARKIAELNDLSNDWTLLSPRRHCLQHSGLKQRSGADSMEREIMPFEEDMNARTYQRTIDLMRKRYEESGRSAERFKDLITLYAQGLGPLALPELIDLGAIRKWTAELGEIPAPVLQPPVKGTASYDSKYLAEGETLRACLLEFFAGAYGIGEADVEGRYSAALALWNKADYPYYSPALVSLNYLTARNRLAKGDEAGAFALANDPVMTYASLRMPNVTPWRASFDQYGIGTRISFLDAARIYDEGWGQGTGPEGIQSALLKASAGQKDIAAAQLRHWMSSQWRSNEEMANAQRAYQAITGSQFQQAKASADPLSNLLGGLFVVSLGILAHCLSKAGNCPAATQGSSYTGDSPAERLTQQFRDQQDRLEAVQNFSWAANGFKD